MTNSYISPHLLEKMNAQNLPWFLRQNFTHVITLAFNRQTTLNGGRVSLKRFHARLDRALLGSRYFKRPQIERSFFYACPEHIASNLHYNLLLRVNADQVSKTTDIVDDLWSKVVKSGSTDVQLVCDAYDYGRWVGYLTKEQAYSAISHENAILSNEFLSD